MEELNTILASLSGGETVPEVVKDKALQQSLVPDTEGRLPGSDGYVDTYDAYFAAYILVDFLSAQPKVTSAGSEGTSVTATAPDWDAARRMLASMSVIMGMQPHLGFILYDNPPSIVPTDMTGRGVYGDINTDLG